jgi:hypothetical protein
MTSTLLFLRTLYVAWFERTEAREVAATAADRSWRSPPEERPAAARKGEPAACSA